MVPFADIPSQEQFELKMSQEQAHSFSPAFLIKLNVQMLVFRDPFPLLLPYKSLPLFSFFFPAVSDAF
jgi:hypothetical protein